MNGEDKNDGEATEGAIVPAPPAPAADAKGNPVNWQPPRPPPRRGAPTILIPGNATPPPGLLAGADMGDDRVFTGDHSTGKVRIFRRQASWNPDVPTSKYFNLLLNEIRRLRAKCGEREFDN